MAILEITGVTTQFVVAEMEYVRLIEQTVDFERKGLSAITVEELHRVREAKKRRDALELRMLAVLETNSRGNGHSKEPQI